MESGFQFNISGFFAPDQLFNVATIPNSSLTTFYLLVNCVVIGESIANTKVSKGYKA